MPTAFSSVGSNVQSLSLLVQSSSVSSATEPQGDEPHGDELHGEEPNEPNRKEPNRNGPECNESKSKVFSTAKPCANGSPKKAFHRIADVRQQQGLSLRTIARRTGLDIKELRRQEDAGTDLKMSELLVWQRALEVPLVDLVEDDSNSLSRPVKERAKMVRIMKTAVTLVEACQSNQRLSRLTTMLKEQLLDLMPELAEIGGWPQCGSRRGADVMGRIFHEPVSIQSDLD